MRRTFDLVLVLLLFPVLLPILVFACLIKYAIDGRPVFYFSRRLGEGCTEFIVYKFRTMVSNREFIDSEVRKYFHDGFESIPLHSSVYTILGRFYEKLQLVECPQIINIVFGDMSFVGCRPLPASHYEELKGTFGEDLANLRFAQKPGLTGIAQLYGKANLASRERLLIEINEGLFYRSDFNLFWKFLLYIYSVIGTLFYVFMGRAPFVDLIYKKIVIARNLEHVSSL